jgi:hypothetical protein
MSKDNVHVNLSANTEEFTKPVDLLFSGRKRYIKEQKCFAPAVRGKCEGDGTATEFDDELSEREYKLTGFCQKCQDATYAFLEELAGQEEPQFDSPEAEVQSLSDEELADENRGIFSYLGENGPDWEFETSPWTQAVRAEVKRREEQANADHSNSYREE